MKVCQKCQRSVQEVDQLVKDKKTDKCWKLTKCGKCGFNFDIEEFTGKMPSGQELMDKFPGPNIQKYWGM